ncbi:hypothetical protein PHYBOEH_007193 [Phytophthora boehmeriae]|uniref:FYVE-type domain-containing protein n=1 Tax=Phytophthora boehmeriae TaxID=109152 RepID=A0A8T1W998_9STRA|nr:hypothetical protein PHYBOEH_007193 [Phytophthora boehmeriae]
MALPLPRTDFPPVNVSAVERRRLSAMVRRRVISILEDERHYSDRLRNKESVVHPWEWKSMGKSSLQKGLQIYRRRRRGRSLRQLAMDEDFLEARQAVELGHPSVIAAGRVNGSIENMMYGMSATSLADLLTGFSYYNPPPKECALLGHLDHATPEDPFHSADFIWALPKLPSFVDQLDVCYLKATGMGVDEDGKSYGYLVLHSVHLPECPEYNRITRAKMYFACLFRETDDGYLDVMARGVFNLKASRTVRFMLASATASFIAGLFNGVGVGESKKLTRMARRNQARQNFAKKAKCTKCLERPSSWSWRVSLHLCRVCGVTICSKCFAKDSEKPLFLGTKKPCSKFKCCSDCRGKPIDTIGIHPAEAEFTVIADFYLTCPQQVSLSSSDSDEDDANLDTMHRNRKLDDALATNSSAMLTNSTADASLAGYEFENDRFSDMSELDSVDFSFSSRKDIEDDDLDLETELRPETVTGSDTNEVVPWGGEGIDSTSTMTSRRHLQFNVVDR